MARYQYRCDVDGSIDVTRPIGTAAPTWPCPVCAHDMARVFSAPMLALRRGAAVAAIDRTRATADVPDVVSALPPAGAGCRAMASNNPALRRLPRP